MAQPDPNAPQPGDPIVFSKFDGVKNTILPERMSPRDLVRAQNVDLDDAGQLRRRRGVTLKVAGRAHSAFTSQKRVTLLVFNGVLSILAASYQVISLGKTIHVDPAQGQLGLVYAQLGDQVYYTSALDNGVVDLTARSVRAWQGTPPSMWLSPVVDPTGTLPPVAGRMIGPPPLGTTLTYFNGRLYIGVGPALWVTDLYTYDYVDLIAGYALFEGNITMLGAVSDGVYVGTDEGLYFLSGASPWPMKKVSVMDAGVVPGSMVYIPSELGNPPQIGLGVDTPVNVSIGFMTQAGFCVASDSGQTVNLTENKVFFPGADSAASLFRRMDGVNQFITSLQHGGSPSDNAAIGDYIEATIIRAADRNLMGS